MLKFLHLNIESLIKGFLYSGLFIALYHNSHRLMLNWWQRKDYNYCYLIPFIVLYLIWEKRETLNRTPSQPTWTGVFPVLFGLVLFWLGELGGEYYTLYISSWFVLIGLCWMHLGWKKLKVMLFPIAFILTMFPPPNFIYFNLSLKLKLISSKLGVMILQAFGQSAYREGNVIDLGFTQLQVVDACNGIRYLFPLIVLAILVSYLYKSRWWKKVFIVLTAIPISIFVNGLRIASVGFLYPIWGQQVAEGFFHDFSGWAIFMVSLGILLIEMWLLNKWVSEREDEAQSSKLKAQRQKTPREKILWSPRFITAVVLMGITALIAQTVNFREAVPIVQSFDRFPMVIDQWHGKPLSMEQKIINELNLSDYIIADYKNGSNKSVNFYTAYYESQRKGESIHSPASCLPGGGWVFHESGLVNLPSTDRYHSNARIKRAFIQKGAARQVSYYWFPMRGRVLTNMWEMKLFNFWDALTKQRTDGALVRVVTPVYPDENVEQADMRLQEFLSSVVPVLDEFLPK